jgi:hypothetical protein
MWFAASVCLIGFSWIVCVRDVYDPNLERVINFSDVFSGFIPSLQVNTRVARNTFLLHSTMSKFMLEVVSLNKLRIIIIIIIIICYDIYVR